jgi:hypothetical protein
VTDDAEETIVLLLATPVIMGGGGGGRARDDDEVALGRRIGRAKDGRGGSGEWWKAEWGVEGNEWSLKLAAVGMGGKWIDPGERGASWLVVKGKKVDGIPYEDELEVWTVQASEDRTRPRRPLVLPSSSRREFSSVAMRPRLMDPPTPEFTLSRRESGSLGSFQERRVGSGRERGEDGVAEGKG